jgi:hypothetical protein
MERAILLLYQIQATSGRPEGRWIEGRSRPRSCCCIKYKQQSGGQKDDDGKRDGRKTNKKNFKKLFVCMFVCLHAFWTNVTVTNKQVSYIVSLLVSESYD